MLGCRDHCRRPESGPYRGGRPECRARAVGHRCGGIATASGQPADGHPASGQPACVRRARRPKFDVQRAHQRERRLGQRRLGGRLVCQQYHRCPRHADPALERHGLVAGAQSQPGYAVQRAQRRQRGRGTERLGGRVLPRPGAWRPAADPALERHLVVAGDRPGLGHAANRTQRREHGLGQGRLGGRLCREASRGPDHHPAVALERLRLVAGGQPRSGQDGQLSPGRERHRERRRLGGGQLLPRQHPAHAGAEVERHGLGAGEERQSGATGSAPSGRATPGRSATTPTSPPGPARRWSCSGTAPRGRGSPARIRARAPPRSPG
jgi:hypothetical protein